MEVPRPQPLLQLIRFRINCSLLAPALHREALDGHVELSLRGYHPEQLPVELDGELDPLPAETTHHGIRRPAGLVRQHLLRDPELNAALHPPHRRVRLQLLVRVVEGRQVVPFGALDPDALLVNGASFPWL